MFRVKWTHCHTHQTPNRQPDERLKYKVLFNEFSNVQLGEYKLLSKGNVDNVNFERTFLDKTLKCVYITEKGKMRCGFSVFMEIFASVEIEAISKEQKKW